jgi:putative transcriptional regulator
VYVKQALHWQKGRGANVKNNLENLRKTNNISQEQLAAELNVSRQTVSSLENGRYNPSVILALKIAKYFNCKVEDVFLLD